MDVQKCPVVGPGGFCCHYDGDGYWPAANAEINYPPDMVMRLAEAVGPNLSLPDGYEWASDTVYVHIGPVVSFAIRLPLANTFITRAVRALPTRLNA